MANNSFSAENTSLILNGRGFTDFLDGDILELNPVNPQTARTRGRNGVNIQNRSDRDVHDLVMRVLMYSDDHKYLNSQLNQEVPVIFNGSLTINYTDDDGVPSVSAWRLQGGSFTEKPQYINNTQEGNSLVEYTIQFNSAINTL